MFGNSLGKSNDQLTKTHHMNSKLFVGNLSFNITEPQLQDTFAVHGTVLDAKMPLDRATGRPRGFAFVTMSSPEEAQKAIAALNGSSLDGRNLSVNEARPREEHGTGEPQGGRSKYRGVGAHNKQDQS